jgi:hypothetical protein
MRVSPRGRLLPIQLLDQGGGSESANVSRDKRKYSKKEYSDASACRVEIGVGSVTTIEAIR